MNFSFVDPWHLFLPREGGHVVGISGSGGKTSLLRAFGRILEAEGVPTILTSTTRTEALDEFEVWNLEDLGKPLASALPSLFFLRDGLTSEGKWRGISAEDVDSLGKSFPDRVILVEVDGSAGMPLKLYRPGEPVWPSRTSLAVVSMSQGAVGEKAGAVVHRFGRQHFEPLGELRADSVWLWEHSLALLTGDGGYLDQIPEDVPSVLALTCMGDQDDSIGLFEFVGEAMKDARLPLVVFCEATGETPYFRTSCRLENQDSTDEGKE